MPGAALLSGYPPADLTVSIGNCTTKVQEGGGEWFVTPSMSADGRVVASARRAASDLSIGRPRLVVSTFSVSDNKWKEYKDLVVFDGSIAISPDGSKLACFTRELAGAPSRLRVLDIRTGGISAGPKLSENAGPHLSWSPDGQRIVFDMYADRSIDGRAIPPRRAIYVLNLEDGTISRIADGMSPAWSPSGEWIAFNDYSPGRDDAKRGWYAVNANRVSLMHPDGSHSKVLATFRNDEDLHVPSVWSPDSKTILVNKFHDEDKATMDVYMLDIATLKLTKEFKASAPVFAWVNGR